MKVIVLGSGVIGTATAYYLAQAGHQVTVLDRQPGPALETSYANAGEISPGYSSPWAAPGVPLKAIKWLFMAHAPLVIRPSLDPVMYSWLLQMLFNCTKARYQINKTRMLRLAEYSRDCMRDLRAATGISYDERTKGTLQLFRTQKQLDAVGADSEILRQFKVPHQVLDRAGCIRIEPALARVHKIVAGGMHLPGDETGDCFKFTQALASMAQENGVRFEFGVSIERLQYEADRITAVHTRQGAHQSVHQADSFVMALGSYSTLMARQLGLKIPVYPMKGYSITLPITDPCGAPESTILDDTNKVALTRLGDRIRVGGSADIAGYDLRLRESWRKTLIKTVNEIFPTGGDANNAEFWCGLRPMTPDSTPILGPTPYSNLFLNTGHGTLGWTMARGSGRVLADLISGRQPEIDTVGLFMDRYPGSSKKSIVLPVLQPRV